ncbi:hypothetical protein LINPERPRIM_LOCUS21723 [Linum perenne]
MMEEDANIWKRKMVSYIIAVVLCPKLYLAACLKYLSLMVDETIANFTKFD